MIWLFWGPEQGVDHCFLAVIDWPYAIAKTTISAIFAVAAEPSKKGSFSKLFKK